MGTESAETAIKAHDLNTYLGIKSGDIIEAEFDTLWGGCTLILVALRLSEDNKIATKIVYIMNKVHNNVDNSLVIGRNFWLAPWDKWRFY